VTTDTLVPQAIFDAGLERQTVRAVTRRVAPFIFLLYVACFLDRVNVGFAALQMNQALGLSAAAYGFGAGMFFVGYILFEVPSNLVLARVGARLWIARIMVTWGIISTSMMFATGPRSFYALRFLLGAAEAGFFPGIIYYLGEWFPQALRARAISRFMVAIPIAGIFGAPLSASLLGLDGRLGLAGWRWLFLIEGIPSIVLGIVTYFYLTDRPAHAKWLSPEQARWLSETMHAEQRQCAERHHGVRVLDALRNRTLWKLALLQALTLVAATYALSFRLPQIIKSFSGFSNLQVGFATAIPSVVAAVAMVAVGISSDRSGERFYHIAASTTVAGIGFFCAAMSHTPAALIVSVCLATAGMLSMVGPFFTLPSTFLTGAAAAAGIALVNSVANISGFVTPYGLGVLKEATGGHTVGLTILGVMQLAGAAFALHMRGRSEA